MRQYHNTFSYREKGYFLKNLHIFVICFLFIILFGFITFDSFSSHTFVGKLVIKEAPIYFSYDEERKRWDGKTWQTYGRDETTATKKYTMTFSYEEGKTKTLLVEIISASVPYVKRDDLALAALKNKDSVPYEYRSGVMYVEYLVEVQGYFTTGYLLNITPLSSFKPEN
jgi:hypothetical protein